MQQAPDAPATKGAPWSRTAAIGCFMVPLGFFSGGMVAVFVSKIVAYVTRAPACDGVPTCNWLEYMLVGAAFGAVTLPTLVIWALRTPKRSDQ
jgi:hypothetical protein